MKYFYLSWEGGFALIEAEDKEEALIEFSNNIGEFTAEGEITVTEISESNYFDLCSEHFQGGYQ